MSRTISGSAAGAAATAACAAWVTEESISAAFGASGSGLAVLWAVAAALGSEAASRTISLIPPIAPIAELMSAGRKILVA